MTPPSAPWSRAFEAATGDTIVQASSVAGGDIGESHRLALASGGRVFLKHYARGPGGIAAAEATGLTWLAEAAALRVAAPIAWGDDWLALEWIDSAPRADDYDRALGRGLAALHDAGPKTFGLASPNWIATLPQANDASPDWGTFYAERRIRPLQRRAHDAGALPRAVSNALDRVVDRIDDAVGPPEPPARLHGDLWAGNVLPDERGAPCLIDPAVYGGHREVDLAMMRLFGGFGAGVFDAYAEAHPLAEGWPQRVALYQIYPLLVHVCLFGGGYVGQLSDAVAAVCD